MNANASVRPFNERRPVYSADAKLRACMIRLVSEGPGIWSHGAWLDAIGTLHRAMVYVYAFPGGKQ